LAAVLDVMELADYTHLSVVRDDSASRKWKLWGYIDARDRAQALRLALESDLAGTEVFIIANADTVRSRPNAALIAEFYPPTSRCGAISESRRHCSRLTRPDGCSATDPRTGGTGGARPPPPSLWCAMQRPGV
jgi:hypothetical protein